MKKHKTDHWYQLTHWDKPNKARCGSNSGLTRWHWRNVTCLRCLKLRTEKEHDGEKEGVGE